MIAKVKCVPSILMLVILLMTVGAKTVQAQTESVLYNFTGQSDGGEPNTGLAIDKAGNLYGVTGIYVLYQLSPSGTFNIFYSFTGFGSDAYPNSALIFDAQGNLYGTTVGNDGEIFMLSPSGQETVLFSFPGNTDAFEPQGGLVFDKAGNLYGSTIEGGGSNNAGTVFQLNPTTGVLTVLYALNGGADGGYPLGVVLDKKGNIYGTTANGGNSKFGVVFKVTAAGKETVLHSFTPNGQDGFGPNGPLAIDSKGNLYGTTTSGGAKGAGTVFKITPSGKETILHSFSGGSDGVQPMAGVVLDAKGNIYGTTYLGGAFGLGTVYKVTPSGTATTLHSFQQNGIDGTQPMAPVIVDAAGNVYGTTVFGGNSSNCPIYGCGTIFKIAPQAEISDTY